MKRNNRVRMFATAAGFVLVAGAVLISGAAAEATTLNTSKQISCDALTYATANTIWGIGEGDDTYLSVTHNSTTGLDNVSPNGRVAVKLVRDDGLQALPTQNFNYTQTRSWSGFAVGNYNLKFKKYDTPVDCNGSFWPGMGSFTLYYRVIYDV